VKKTDKMKNRIGKDEIPEEPGAQQISQSQISY
jgi:hypothetical protein